MIHSQYRTLGTIWPNHLRERRDKPDDLSLALSNCRAFNKNPPILIVDGKNRVNDQALVFRKLGWEVDQSGRLEVKFRKDWKKSTSEEGWYDIDISLWIGNVSHAFATHRLVLGINGLLVRPYNEWSEFKTGPHKDGEVLHFTLLYDESIPHLTHLERQALQKIEQIDAALGRYRLRYTEQTITVTETASTRSVDLPECGILVDNHGGAARILLPEWFKVGTLELGPPDARKPAFTLPVSTKHPNVILTPRKLKDGGVPAKKDVRVRIHPGDYVMFY